MDIRPAETGDEWVVDTPAGALRTKEHPDVVRALVKAKGLDKLAYELERGSESGVVAHLLQHGVYAYVEPQRLDGRRILDFGCGTGISTTRMARAHPEAEFTGVELEAAWIDVARVRAQVYGLKNVDFAVSPSGDELPELGQFDYVLLSAVWEHLLPEERQPVAHAIWRALRPGGLVFLNQTPHRFWPIESHTTGLPLINYLPSGLARLYAARSSRLRGDEPWATLLRYGIRGGSVHEITRCFGTTGMPARVISPRPEVGDRLDLWLQASSSLRMRHLKRATWVGLKGIKAITGHQVAPVLTLAIEKVAPPA